MSSRDNIQVKATVTEIMRQGAYRVELANGHRCVAKTSGEVRLNLTSYSVGDQVTIDFHPYDLTRARIIGLSRE
jgi:translation initiation factor IF-1